MISPILWRSLIPKAMGVVLALVAFRWAWSADPPPRYAEMSNEELAERAFHTKARSELERRIEAAPRLERDALQLLLREAPSAEAVVADYADAELIDLILSAPGADAERAAHAVLAGRFQSATAPTLQSFRELVVNKVADTFYPDVKDQTEIAAQARYEYLQLGGIAARYLPEKEALPIIKGMTIERKMEGHLNLMARMLAAMNDPGPDTIELVEFVFNNWESTENNQYQGDNEHGQTQSALYATLGHAGDPGLDALLRLGGWESDPLGLSVVASMPGSRPRDALIEQYERRSGEKGFADPFILQALARRLKKDDDPELATFLRKEIPKHLVIPTEGRFNVPSLKTGVGAASATGDPYYLPYLREFLAAVDNGEGLHEATDYKSYPVTWRENVIRLLEDTERAIERLENVEAKAAEGVPETE